MTFSAHNVVSLFRAKSPSRDWDNSELAQFVRVESALRQAGIFVDTQRGMTDEGDPWFVYCRHDTGDVFLHIARFDGLYVAASPTMSGPLVRKRFTELFDELVRDNPVILQPSPNRRPGPDLYIHPSTMLIAAVAALFYKNAPIRSEELGDNPLRQTEGRGSAGFGIFSDVYSVALVSAMAIIAVLHHNHSDNVVVEENQSDELALLDGILFNFGASHDALPSFEGNIEPTGMIGGVAQSATDVVVAEQIAGDWSDTASEASVALQSLFSKFADTIVAASSAVSDAAEFTVASHHGPAADWQTARSETPVEEGGEKALPAATPSSPAFAIAGAAPDFKNGEPQPVQQVSLAPSTDQPVNEPAVVQVAALSTVPTATDFLTSTLQLETPVADQDSDTDTSLPQPVTDGEVLVPVDVVAEVPAVVFYDYVQVAGMYVLLMPGQAATETSSAAVADIPSQPGFDVPLLGISGDVDLLAVA